MQDNLLNHGAFLLNQGIPDVLVDIRLFEELFNEVLRGISAISKGVVFYEVCGTTSRINTPHRVHARSFVLLPNAHHGRVWIHLQHNAKLGVRAIDLVIEHHRLVLVDITHSAVIRPCHAVI